MSVNFEDFLVVIPARYKSSRLPGKPLISIAGKPMIIRTAERCLEVVPREHLVIATDDDRIAEVCRDHGLRVELTADHLTGSDRVAEVASRVPARTYVNVQGDEPVLNPDDLKKLLEASSADPLSTYVGYCPMSEREWLDTKYPRLLFGLNQNLIYIGRANVPGSHDQGFRVGYRQVCLHAYPAGDLTRFASTGRRTPIESIEDHEMMRFLELGLPVKVLEMSADSIAVDRPDDVAKVEQHLAEIATRSTA